MKTAYIKENFRKINKTKTRFISLVLIVALGVLFFSGMNTVSPDMENTMNNYLEEYNVSDIQILSELGFTAEDVNTIKNISEITEVIPSYIYDVILEKDGKRMPVRTNSIGKEQKVNKAQILDGRYIENDNECLIDERLVDEHNYKIGDKITLESGNDTNINEELKYTTYTIVGKIRIPTYISKYYGTTELENGELLGCLYLSDTVYKTDIYTNIYIKTNISNEIPKLSNEYEEQLKQIVEKVEEIGKERADIRYKEIYNENYAEILDGKNKIADVKNKLKDAKKELEEAKEKLNELSHQIYVGNVELTKMEKSNPLFSAYYNNLEYYQTILAEGRKTYYSNLKTYNEETQKAETEIEDKEKQIKEAEEKLEKISGKWYVIGLYDNEGFVAFKNDLDKVGIMGKVFPVMFFIVAALVSITTITRMIEEDRGTIAIEKALGYSKTSIILKYVLYTAVAATIGLLLGTVIGSYIITDVLYNAYRILYSAPDLIMNINIKCFVIATIITFISTVLCSIIITIKELNCKTAELMRPKSPKEGKEIFLEKCDCLWNRFSFLLKVSIRNIFRYKRRLCMAVVGIAGCTALIYSGLSLKESVDKIATKQYGEIKLYDMQINLDYEMSSDMIEESLEKIIDLDEVESAIYVREKSTEIEANNINKSIFYLVGQPEEITNYVKLQNRTTKNNLELNDNGVIISEKLANTLKVKEGDKVKIGENGNQKEEIITGITENYLFNYIYMTSNVYEEIFGEEILYNEILANTGELTEQQEKNLATKIKEDEKFSGISLIRVINEEYIKSLDSLMTIVFLCIGCASLLSFIVLFNLNSINIEERQRELATIKVLGFYDNEVASYVFRENIILTIIGGLVGLVLGTLILGPIMKSGEVETIYLPVELNWLTYAIAFAITIVFTIITDKIMDKRLKKIDMIESLKSVE